MSHPQLDDLVRQIEEATARARALMTSADARRLAARPSSDEWSAIEALGHLTLTTKGYLPLLDAALASAAPQAVDDTHRYRPGLLGGLLAWSLEPPYRMKSKTLGQFTPALSPPPDAVLHDFVEHQALLRQRIDACRGRDLNRLMIQSPFNARLRYTVYGALVILLAHERRHLWQGERTVKRLGAGG